MEVKSVLDKYVIKEASHNMDNLRKIMPRGARWFLIAAGARISVDKVRKHSGDLFNGSGVLVLEGIRQAQPYYCRAQKSTTVPPS